MFPGLDLATQERQCSKCAFVPAIPPPATLTTVVIVTVVGAIHGNRILLQLQLLLLLLLGIAGRARGREGGREALVPEAASEASSMNGGLLLLGVQDIVAAAIATHRAASDRHGTLV
jgi:hypothetical protein